MQHEHPVFVTLYITFAGILSRSSSTVLNQRKIILFRKANSVRISEREVLHWLQRGAFSNFMGVKPLSVSPDMWDQVTSANEYVDLQMENG